jgi:nucleoside-diphosphate kinase
LGATVRLGDGIGIAATRANVVKGHLHVTAPPSPSADPRPFHLARAPPLVPQADPTEKFAFIVEWLDPHSGLTRRYQFLYWPATRDVEMFDLKNRRAFLKKTPIPTLAMEDLFLGAVVAVYARQLKVVEFGDAFTEQRFATTRQRAYAVVSEKFAKQLGKTINAFQKSGFSVADLKMVAGKGTGLALVADGAVEKLRSMLPELEQHFGAECVSVSESVEAAATMEAEFLAAPASCKLDGSTTLCLVKPSAMEHLGLVMDKIVSTTDGDGQEFVIVGAKTFALDRVAALEFYEVYRGVAPEFSMMVDEITSGAFVALEVAGDGNVVSRFRELAGPVDPEMARAVRPKSLRAAFGFDKVRNAVHCTDLPEDGALETHYFFKILQEA